MKTPIAMGSLLAKIAVGRGRKTHDKRQDLKEKEAKKEMRNA